MGISFKPVRLAAAAAAAALLAPPAFAGIAAGDGRAVVLEPLSLVNVTRLSFGDIAPGAAAGTVVINPDTEARTVTGGVTAIGGTVSAARFLGTGAANSNVAIIREPNGSITITRSGGTETMIVDDFTVEGGNGARQIRNDRVLDFRIGGRLLVGANQVEGTYVGTFTVIVDYR